MLITAALLLLLPAHGWPMAGFEYYDQTPEKAWAKTRQSLADASGVMFASAAPGGETGAEELPKRYVTRWYTLTLPPGWAARPRKQDYTNVVFYPKDKRSDVVFEVNTIVTGLDLNGFTSRYVKWTKSSEDNTGVTFVGRENTIQHYLPCSIVTTYVTIANKRLFQVMMVIIRGDRTYTVKCITDSATWLANFDEFRGVLDSFLPEDCSVKPCTKAGMER